MPTLFDRQFAARNTLREIIRARVPGALDALDWMERIVQGDIDDMHLALRNAEYTITNLTSDDAINAEYLKLGCDNDAMFDAQDDRKDREIQ